MRINAEQTLTDDRLFRGALALMQPARGHRAGTDAVLLVSTTRPRPSGSLISARHRAW